MGGHGRRWWRAGIDARWHPSGPRPDDGDAGKPDGATDDAADGRPEPGSDPTDARGAKPRVPADVCRQSGPGRRHGPADDEPPGPEGCAGDAAGHGRRSGWCRRRGIDARCREQHRERPRVSGFYRHSRTRNRTAAAATSAPGLCFDDATNGKRIPRRRQSGRCRQWWLLWSPEPTPPTAAAATPLRSLPEPAEFPPRHGIRRRALVPRGPLAEQRESQPGRRRLADGTAASGRNDDSSSSAGEREPFATDRQRTERRASGPQERPGQKGRLNPTKQTRHGRTGRGVLHTTPRHGRWIFIVLHCTTNASHGVQRFGDACYSSDCPQRRH
mmetsp:Transcript_23539/g.52179  ORF Transcript_23539/g.52179 Transcript_23539/m.52179 type:complete len:329 (+) Transcript_23539:1198-2184(+)